MAALSSSISVAEAIYPQKCNTSATKSMRNLEFPPIGQKNSAKCTCAIPSNTTHATVIGWALVDLMAKSYSGTH